MTNWWGAEAHPSDFLVHWSSMADSREFEKENAVLRAAWDLIHSDCKIAAAYDILAAAVRDMAENQAAEDAAGESF